MKKDYKKLLEEIIKEAQRKQQDPATIPGWNSGLTKIFGDPPKTNTPIVLQQPAPTPPPAQQGGGQQTGTGTPANTGGGWGNLGFGGGGGGGGTGTGTTNWTAPARGGGGGGGGAPRNEAVRGMQLAMQDLAGAFMRDAGSGTMFHKQDAHQGQGTEQQVSGRKAFTDFLAEQYVGELPEDKKGVEYSTNPNTQSYQQKRQSQTDIYEMDVVMNTLQRIGSPKPGDEFKADGFWQFRTDNALKNMAGFANALLSFEGDFPLQNDSFQKSDLDEMYKLLSGYEVKNGWVQLSEQEKTQRATQLAKLLKKIGNLYNSFRRQFLARPSIRSLVEGNRGFDKYGPEGNNKDVLTDPEKAASTSNTMVGGIRFRGYQGGDANKAITITSIPLSALNSVDAFDAFLRKCGYTDKADATNIARWRVPIINLIKKQLDTYGTEQGTGRGYAPERI